MLMTGAAFHQSNWVTMFNLAILPTFVGKEEWNVGWADYSMYCAVATGR